MDKHFHEGPCNMFIHTLADHNGEKVACARIKKKDDHNGESSTININPFTNDGIPIRKLYIQKFARSTTPKDLTTLFSTYGKVEHCKLVKKKGFAFLTFTNAEDAMTAVKDGRGKNIHLHGRNLRVTPAHSRLQPDNLKGQPQSDQKKTEITEISTQCDLNEDSQIHGLNDDCLIHIFSFLPIADRVRFERVCRRWRIISLASWSSFKQLDLSQSSWWVTSPRSFREINTQALKKVLFRTGEFLSHLDFSNPMAKNLSKSSKLSKMTMGMIGHFCPNLQYIDFTALNVYPSGIKILSKKCTKIIKLSLGNCISPCDTNLSTLFIQNDNLKYLKLVFSSITGKCLLDIPSDSIQEIYLNGCDGISPHYFSEAIQKFTKLHTLSLEGCDCFNDQAVKAISSRVNSLRNLQLCECYPMINENNMTLITALANLETLNVSQNDCINDAFLLTVGKNCKQLKNVDISSCNEVTNEGLYYITSLPNLECLTVNYLSCITDSALTDMPKLKTLISRGCPEIGNTGLISLIEESHCLQLMDLSGCDSVENEFIEAAVKATANRKNELICKIYVGGTGVDVTSISEESPLLKVIDEDLSDDHLKPDYYDRGEMYDMEYFGGSDSDSDYWDNDYWAYDSDDESLGSSIDNFLES